MSDYIPGWQTMPTIEYNTRIARRRVKYEAPGWAFLAAVLFAVAAAYYYIMAPIMAYTPHGDLVAKGATIFLAVLGAGALWQSVRSILDWRGYERSYARYLARQSAR